MPTAENLASSHIRPLHYTYTTGPLAGSLLCRSAMDGSGVEAIYGCHAHLYPTDDPVESHGAALCWSVARSPLSAHSLLALCRVANSSRKVVALVGSDDSEAIVLTYTVAL